MLFCIPSPVRNLSKFSPTILNSMTSRENLTEKFKNLKIPRNACQFRWKCRHTVHVIPTGSLTRQLKANQPHVLSHGLQSSPAGIIQTLFSIKPLSKLCQRNSSSLQSNRSSPPHTSDDPCDDPTNSAQSALHKSQWCPYSGWMLDTITKKLMQIMSSSRCVEERPS